MLPPHRRKDISHPVPDLSDRYQEALKAHRLPGLSLGGDTIFPNYEGYSLLNIPSSICQLLGAPGFGAGALLPELLAPFEKGVRRVILVLIDALGFLRFQQWLAEGAAGAWRPLMQDGLLAPLTSIVPSTTSAALTSLWTGVSAAAHGIAGYELWLKEYGLVANMITHSPMSFQNEAGSLSKAGFQPEQFVQLPTLGTHLASNGVCTYAFQHHSILRSGLSRIFFSKEVEPVGFNTMADLWITLRQLIEARPSERQYIWLYWGEVDHYSHLYGPDDPRPAAEFEVFGETMQRLFLKSLDPTIRKDTLLILTADHGQISTQKDPHYDLKNHPNLLRRLHIQPTGENRLAYFYIRPGQVEAVRESLERTWPNQFFLLEPSYAVQAGLFGPGPNHPHLLDRLGDLMVISRGNAYLWWSDKENILIGRHGALTPEEMIIPFLAVRI